MEQFLERICKVLQDFFFRGFGDYKDTQGDDIALPAIDIWQAVVSMSKPCRLMLQNLDAVNEIQITWNTDNPIGYRILAGTQIVLDDVAGLLYAKAPSGATLNYLAIALITNE